MGRLYGEKTSAKAERPQAGGYNIYEIALGVEIYQLICRT
jgi:hypothetical protein